MIVIAVSHDPKLNLTSFAEFVPIIEKGNAGLKLEEEVNLNKALEICRDKLNPTKPWIEGEVLDQVEQSDGKVLTRFAFNRDKKGWHYGWASNKHTCNASHALQAYIMQKKDPNTLVVKGVYQSPTFTLFCRRRRRFSMVPSAPVAPPASKKRSSSGRARQKKRTSTMPEEDEEEGKLSRSPSSVMLFTEEAM